MGTVRRLAAAAGGVTLGPAADAYLATLRGAEQASTRRTYGRVLRWVVAEFGAESEPGEIDPERFAGWFTARWADRAPSTWKGWDRNTGERGREAVLPLFRVDGERGAGRR